MMRLPFALLPLLALLALTACETVQGAGRDLQTAGAVVTDEAQDAQSGM
jgi:predicted small secreted protein